MPRKRVGIVGLLHESNTFVEEPTTVSNFESDVLLKGRAIVDRFRDAPHEVGGFLEQLDEDGIEAVPVFVARALPSGVIERAAFEKLVDGMLAELLAAGPLDGILAAPHGATVAEGSPDADGTWLSRLRTVAGDGIPIVATLDPHANLTPAMVEATDAIVAYATNPHLDQRETGRKAASLLARTLRGEIAPAQAAAFPPIAIPIVCQDTGKGALRSFYRDSEAASDAAGMLSHSIVLGFPYADVAEMGSSILAVADGSRAEAQSFADRVAGDLWTRRESFRPDYLSIEEAVALASSADSSPVVMLDMGDNVGGGSRADETGIAREWLRAGEGELFVCLWDSEVARRAGESGAGSRYAGPIGNPCAPLEGEFEILSLHDGRFRETEARHGGFSEFDQGRTAILREVGGKVRVMVTGKRMVPFSLAQLTSFGVDPLAFRAVVAKGVIAPMAAYAEVARGGFLHVDTPGTTRADMTKLEYRNRRRPLFPFED